MTELEQWLEYIGQVHPVGWDLGLERVSSVGERMGLLHPAPATLLVAGTNGKGSTCEYLERFALASGLTVGKSTSPHLLTFNERIAINGIAATDAAIVQAFKAIEAARQEITLTYFEFGALASLYLFAKAKVDVAILEIGLGGRLDAMNIVDADLSIITSISLDHQSWLGDTREAIAREKAGIMRNGRVCIVADRDPPQTLIEYAGSIQTPLVFIGKDFPSFQPPAAAFLPQDSFDAACEAARMLGWDTDAAGEIASNTRLLGRQTLLRDKCDLMLDVAHNPAAALNLARSLAEDWAGRNIHAVVGMYADKDIESVLDILMPFFKTCHLTDLAETRGEKSEQIFRRMGPKPDVIVGTYAKIADALDGARSVAESGDLILVFGSFPVVAGALQCLEPAGTNLKR